MHLRTLGRLELEGSSFTQRKALLLLAYLALEGPQVRRRLAELFWWGSKDPLNNLTTTLIRTKQGAPGAIDSDDVRAWTDLPCDAVELLEAENNGEAAACVALYQGTFLEGVRLQDTSTELEEWLYSTREALGSRTRQALLELVEADAGVGEFTLGAEQAQRAYLLPGAAEPEAEELERLYLLLRAGEHREALEVRKEAAGYDLDLNLSAEVARSALRKGKSTATRKARYNLPVQPTQFVGREAEKTKLGELLLDPACRLLTIMGPGGIGKTRLAIEAAASQPGSFTDGVYFVPFADVTSATAMPYAIADALGLTTAGQTDVAEYVLAYLERKQVLLVLDNLEHLPEGLELVRSLWERAAGVKLLVTSRERLNLQPERVFLLSGMITPEDEGLERSDAVALFLQSTSNLGLEDLLDEASTPAIARACQLVGGMPLAIELAASWLRVLPPQGITARIEEGLDMLEASARDVPARHSSIRAVFDHSWDLLSENEQEVFRRLSVFQGGFSLEAAGEIVNATLPMIASLVDKSLLNRTPEGRYRWHPLLLEYAREKLAEHPQERAETQQGHGLHHLEFLRELASDVMTRKVDPSKLLDEERPNFKAAWIWAVESDRHEELIASEWALNIAYLRRKEEAAELFAVAARPLDESNPAHHAALGYVLLGQGHNDYGQKYTFEQRVALFERVLKLLRPLGEERGVAEALVELASTVLMYSNDYALAKAYLQEALPLARKISEPISLLRTVLPGQLSTSHS